MFTYEIAEEGGNFIRAFSLARCLVSSGHEVTLVASNKKAGLKTSTKQVDGVTIVEIGCVFPRRIRHNGTSPVQVFNRLRRYFFTFEYDLVHGFGHRPSVFLPGWILANIHRVPYIADWSDLWGFGGIATLRGGPLGFLQALADTVTEFLVYRLANAVTLVSGTFKNKLPETKKIEVIYPGSAAKTNKKIQYKTPENAKSKIGFASDYTYVTFLGNAYYDIEVVMQAFRMLQEKGFEKIRLVLIGNKASFMREAQRRYGENILCLGFVPHQKTLHYLLASDVLLLPYRNRTINQYRFPNKLGNYLSAGRPVLAHATGDISSYIGSNPGCVLLSESPETMAKHIAILAKNEKLAQRLGKLALHLAQQRTWEKEAQTLEAFYNQVLEK